MNSILYGRHVPLVVLTVATQAAVGISIFRVLHFMTGNGHGSLSELFVLVMLGLIGAVVSVFHLGHPGKMHTALKNPMRSWLSREGICLALFMAMALVQMVFGLHNSMMPSIVLAVLGMALLLIQAMIYVVPGYSAMGNGAPVLLFLMSGLTIGISLTGWFGDEGWRQSLLQLARVLFSAGFLTAFLLPWFWRLGNDVISDTAAAWFRSRLYYLWIILGFALPLLTLTLSGQVPVWLPILVVTAECLGRVLFFQETKHISDYIGKL